MWFVLLVFFLLLLMLTIGLRLVLRLLPLQPGRHHKRHIHRCLKLLLLPLLSLLLQKHLLLKVHQHSLLVVFLLLLPLLFLLLLQLQIVLRFSQLRQLLQDVVLPLLLQLLLRPFVNLLFLPLPFVLPPRRPLRSSNTLFFAGAYLCEQKRLPKGTVKGFVGT